MFIAILTIIIGAVLTAGGAQGLIAQGIFNNRRSPQLNLQNPQI